MLCIQTLKRSLYIQMLKRSLYIQILDILDQWFLGLDQTPGVRWVSFSCSAVRDFEQ